MKVSSLLSEYFESTPARRGRLFETRASDLPVAVKQKTWTRDEEGVGRNYKFTDRERMKDFVQATMDFDDQSGTGFHITIESQEVSVKLAVGEGYRSADWSMAMLDSIYNEINEIGR